MIEQVKESQDFSKHSSSPSQVKGPRHSVLVNIGGMQRGLQLPAEMQPNAMMHRQHLRETDSHLAGQVGCPWLLL